MNITSTLYSELEQVYDSLAIIEAKFREASAIQDEHVTNACGQIPDLLSELRVGLSAVVMFSRVITAVTKDTDISPKLQERLKNVFAVDVPKMIARTGKKYGG